jgi:hypothetical protein
LAALGLNKWAAIALYLAVFIVSCSIAAGVVKLSAGFWQAQGAVMTRGHINWLGGIELFASLVPSYLLVSGVANRYKEKP